MKKSSKRPTAKAETIKVTIDSLDQDGIGQARHEQLQVLVPGAYPGETLIARVEHRGKFRIYARLQRLLRNAPDRTTASPCPHERGCLGCPLISLNYPAQLTLKQQRVSQALADQGLLREGLVQPTLAAESRLGYRTSAKLVVTRERGKVIIGLYRRGSHQVVPIEDCPLHHPLVNRIVKVVRDEVAKQQISVYDPRHQRGLLRYLLIRVSPASGKAMVTLVSRDRDLRQLPKLGKWLMRKLPEVISVHENINASTGNVIFGQETIKLHGTPDLFDRVGDIRLRIAPGSFFQVNNQQAARIYGLARQWGQLSKKDIALDLYCGIGGIALHLAKDAGQVYGIEVVPEAVRNAADNARLNSLDNCRFRAGDASEELERLAGELPELALATLNPPRKGCDPEVLETLCRLAPRQLIYVSCDPGSLARDLALLSEQHYRIETVQPVDMFPQTAHVETLVQLLRNEEGPA